MNNDQSSQMFVEDLGKGIWPPRTPSVPTINCLFGREMGINEETGEKTKSNHYGRGWFEGCLHGFGRC